MTKFSQYIIRFLHYLLSFFEQKVVTSSDHESRDEFVASNSSLSQIVGNCVDTSQVASSSHSSNYVLGKSRKDITNETRNMISQGLLARSKNGSVEYGSMMDFAETYSVSTRSIKRIWKKTKEDMSSGLPINVSSKRIGKIGRRKVKISEAAVSDIALKDRTTLESFAGHLNMSKTTLYRRFKDGDLIRNSNAIKPALTEKNMRERVQFCLSIINPQSLGSVPTFYDMYDRVHIDEKWFYITKTSQRYYLLPGEVAPKRSCKSKRFIGKVMFLATVAHPRVDMISGENFSGKIGIFPFVQMVPAKRTSKNRVSGTLEMKPIDSITKEVTKRCLIDQVLPAIRSKWPAQRSKTIFIQQDNARAHISANDQEFVAAAKQNGFDICLHFQPPNSPDMNVLDLGYFASIQALQQKKSMTKVEDLVAAVQNSFDELPIEKLNHVFLSLQACMVKVLELFGENHYDPPHIGKRRLEHLHELPISLSIDENTLKQAQLHIQNVET